MGWRGKEMGCGGHGTRGERYWTLMNSSGAGKWVIFTNFSLHEAVGLKPRAAREWENDMNMLEKTVPTAFPSNHLNTEAMFSWQHDMNMMGCNGHFF